VSLNYNGGTLASASIVAAANGVSNAVATLSPRPTIYEYALPTPTNRPQFIAAGSDGNMWFTESPGGIATTPDGSLWFTEPGVSLNPGKIGRLVY